MKIIYGTEDNFEQLINDEKVLVDFFATWCGPCKMLGSVLEEIAQEKEIKIVKIDIDKNPNLAKKYGVMSVPTLFIFNKGKQINKTIGYMPKDNLINWINGN